MNNWNVTSSFILLKSFSLFSGNLPIVKYLLSLDCDKFLTDLNIDHILKQAIDASNDNYSCIDTLLMKEKIRNRITLEQIKVTVALIRY